jgi:NADH-quinone oxidoreductase subunit C
LPDALAGPLRVQPSNGNGRAAAQQDVQEDAAASQGDTFPPPSDGDAAAAKDDKAVEAHTTGPRLSDDDAVVTAERLPDVMRFVRDRLGYELLSHITAVDYIAYGVIEVFYQVYQLSGGPGQIIRVRVPRDNAVIPSITPMWPGANLQEREAWDLYGVQFPGHPYHRRVYMWEEFEGHPMRKDFQKIGDAYYHFKWKGEDDGE